MPDNKRHHSASIYIFSDFFPSIFFRLRFRESNNISCLLLTSLYYNSAFMQDIGRYILRYSMFTALHFEFFLRSNNLEFFINFLHDTHKSNMLSTSADVIAQCINWAIACLYSVWYWRFCLPILLQSHNELKREKKIQF